MKATQLVKAVNNNSPGVLVRNTDGDLYSAVSGTDIKTINGDTILGSGDVDMKTIDFREPTGSGDIQTGFHLINLALGVI